MASWQETATATFLLVIMLFADFSSADDNSTTTVVPTTVTTGNATHTAMSTEAYNATTTHELTTSGNFTLTTTTYGNVTSSAFTGNATTGTFEPTTAVNMTTQLMPVTTPHGSSVSMTFNVASFFGGIILGAAVVALGLVGWKFYQHRRQKDVPYSAMAQ